MPRCVGRRAEEGVDTSAAVSAGGRSENETPSACASDGEQQQRWQRRRPGGIALDGQRTGLRGFGTIEYWDREFGDDGEYKRPFDWLATWDAVGEDIMHILPDRSSHILIPGCGNAPFQLEMYDAGYRSMVCGDLSSVVIRKLQETCDPIGRQIRWELLDATDMPYDDETFDAVVDKSLLDCLRCCPAAGTVVESYLDEVFRVLVPRGLLLLVSCHGESSLRADLRGRRWKVTEIQTYAWSEGDSAPSAEESLVTLCAVQKLAGLVDEGAVGGVPAAGMAQQNKKDRKRAEKNRRRAIRASLLEAGLEEV